MVVDLGRLRRRVGDSLGNVELVLASVVPPEVRSAEASQGVSLVHMRNLVGDDELEDVFLVVAEEVEQTSVDVDVAAWRRERVDLVGIQDCELVLDVLVLPKLDQR